MVTSDRGDHVERLLGWLPIRYAAVVPAVPGLSLNASKSTNGLEGAFISTGSEPSSMSVRWKACVRVFVSHLCFPLL